MASDEHENEESEHHIESESLVVLIFFLCILVSIISREINRRIKFPYTPLLIAFGILFGSTNFWGYITEGHSIVVEINPHGILLILLPILIFESSYNAHLSVLRFNFIQVFLLAGPGVVITALLLAVALKPILGYTDADLSWSEALILGFILGTTDPVAVVALLKELGAPLHINTLIENESLFNDGIAMVFFTIFLSLAKGEE